MARCHVILVPLFYVVVAAKALQLYIREGSNFVPLAGDFEIYRKASPSSARRFARQAEAETGRIGDFGYVQGVRMSREEAIALWERSSPERRRALFSPRYEGFANCSVWIQAWKEIAIEGSCYRTATGIPFCRSSDRSRPNAAPITSFNSAECTAAAAASRDAAAQSGVGRQRQASPAAESPAFGAARAPPPQQQPQAAMTSAPVPAAAAVEAGHGSVGRR